MAAQSLAILPADPMTTSLLKFSLDMECYYPPQDAFPPIASPKISSRTFPKLPKHAVQSWDGELDQYQKQIDEQYGMECTSAVLFGDAEAGDVMNASGARDHAMEE